MTPPTDPLPILFTCPRAAHQTSNKVDRWVYTRWEGPDKYWPEGRTLQKPRTCSFCGSAYPGDVFMLLELGWEDNRGHAETNATARGMLHTPGTRAERVAYTRRRCILPNTRSREMQQPYPSLHFHVAHFTDAQLRVLNDLSDAAYKRLPH